MSLKYERIRSATYWITLSDEENIFGIGCGHLYRFLNIIINDNRGLKSSECEAIMLKMHLEIYESPLTAETEEQQNVEELQLAEEIEGIKKILQAKDDVINQLMIRIKNLEENIAFSETTTTIPDIDRERINALHKNSNNIASQSLVHVMQNSDVDVNNEADLMSAFIRHRSTPYINRKYNFTVDNIVTIQVLNANFTSSTSPLYEVMNLFNDMGYSLDHHQILRIDARIKCLRVIIYDVFLCCCHTKNAILRQTQYLKDTTNNFTIKHYDPRYDLLIKNLEFSNPSLEIAMLVVKNLALLIDLCISDKNIESLDVFMAGEKTFVLEISFGYAHIAPYFRMKKHIFKKYQKVGNLKIY